MTKLTAGRYRARILYHVVTTNSAGNPEIRISCLPYAEMPTYPLPPNYTPAPITIYMTLTAGTLGDPEKPGWVLLTLRHLGFNTADLALLDPAHEMAHSFTGREIIIIGSEDEYKGKKRVRFNILRNQSDQTPVAQSVLTALSQKHRDVLSTLTRDPEGTDTPF
jgi:hypothetical protein